MFENGSSGNTTDDVALERNASKKEFLEVFVAPLWQTDFPIAVFYCVLVGVALTLGTFGNLIILTVTFTTDAMNKIGRYFVINLAMADLCVAGIADPMCILGVIKGEEWFNDKWILCEIVASLCLTACFCAFLSLTNVTVNRYVFVCHHSSYHKIYTKTSTIILCLSSWVLAFLFEFPNFIGWGDHYFDQKNHQCIWDRTADLSYTVFVAAGLIGSPLCLMAMCFVLIFRKIWKTKYDVFSIDKDDPQRLQKVWEESLKASKTLVIIFIVFIVCWTPYAIVTAIDVNNSFSMETHLFVTLLAHFHSSTTIVVYSFSNRNFRKKAMLLLACGKPAQYKAASESNTDKTTSGLGDQTFKYSDKRQICFTTSNSDLITAKQLRYHEQASENQTTTVNGSVLGVADKNQEEAGLE